MRYAVDVADDTVAALAAALDRFATLGVPADAKVRVRTRASFSPDGAYARSVTVRWTQPVGDA